MPTGTPDFNAQPETSITSPTFDLGEVSNHQLMGGGNLSRSGRWFWATGFENGLQTDYFVGGISAPFPSSPKSTCYQGSFCLASITQANINDQNSFYKYFLSQQSPGKWGIELMLDIDSLNTEVDIILKSQTALVTYTGTVRIVVGGNTNNISISYEDASGVFQTFSVQNSSFALGTNGATTYHNVKLVCDFSNFTLVRFILDGTVFSLNVPMRNIGAGSDNRQSFQIKHRTKANSSSTAYIDNVILTADEP